MELVEQSCRIHKSLHAELKRRPPILSSDTIEHLHKVLPRRRGALLEGHPEFRGVVFAKMFSGKKSEALNGALDEIESRYRKQWADGGDHFLLKEILEHGLVPTSSWQQQMQSSSEPPELKNVYEVVKRRGYEVPDSCKKVPHGEAELFFAAMYMAIECRYNYPRWGRDDVLDQQLWRNEISSITGQFVIPDPLVDWKKWPYVADQLWIINDGSRTARLVVIEIDGAVHLDAAKKENDKRRDIKLNGLGYQVVRVNEAWCRVDPFRVVAEILREIGLYSDFADGMVGGNLSSIDDYVCAFCGQPMVRHEDNSIKEVFSGRDVCLVHNSCFDQIQEEKYETGESRFELAPEC